MADRADAAAVLITGVYGTGKSTLVEAIAGELEERAIRYGALDLDWLGWFDHGVSGGGHEAGWPVKLKNVDAVVGNYYETGVRRFVLGGSILTFATIEELRAVLAMPTFVVRLTLPIEEIERRLSSAVTTGREDDIRVTREWVAEGRGDGIGDLVLVNDRPILDAVNNVLTELAW